MVQRLSFAKGNIMARWTNASLVTLGGVDKNVIIDELTYGENQFWDTTFSYPNGLKIQSVSGLILTVTGDTSVVAVNGKILVTGTTSYLTITAIAGQTITVDRAIGNSFNNYTLESPLDLTGCTLEFKFAPRVATVVDGRNGLDITAIADVESPTVTGSVLTTVPGKLLTLGQVRLSLTATQIGVIEPIPELDNDQVLMLTGYFSVTMPSSDGVTPQQIKIQRMAISLITDGIVV